MSRYRHHLFFCTHRRGDADTRGCCQAKGSEDLLDYAKQEVARRGLKREIRVNGTGCLNACATGPSVVVYPVALWYRIQTRADVDALLAAHVEDTDEDMSGCEHLLRQRHVKEST